jgi:hypothetical protein
MATRFNRHVPALCAVCTAPLSVRERRNCEYDPEMVCTWHAYVQLRERFLAEERQAFWISESSSDDWMSEGDTVVEGQVVIVDPWTLFGVRGEEGDLE